MVTMSVSVPSEWRAQLDEVCGYGKPFDTYSALLRKLITDYLKQPPRETGSSPVPEFG